MRRHSVLVVDDEPAIRELLKLHLANAGYDVRLAEDAIVAERSLRESPPDLVVVDVAMPYRGGLELVAGLSGDEQLSRLPVIFITGHEGLASGARALGVGCLKKPFAVDALLDLVGRKLGAERGVGEQR
ncbi:MAG TPA: response regulator [Burkholderiales bacterium]|nr:response regulator [Burkholderiales bacterium]